MAESSQKANDLPSDVQRKPGLKDGPAFRILVVDDNIDAAKALSWMLETLGHKVYVAFDGNTALKLAQEVVPHAVLLDLGMPAMNGLELCQVMRQSAELRNTIFIAGTGWDPKHAQEMSKEAGFDHYLLKPIEMEHLRKVLTGLMDY